ncbi:MAG: serine hydrolase domain-containing protein [Candidatus Omnitrophota bacterium]
MPFGNFTFDADSPVVREETVFDVASLTKAIPTSSLALQLIDKGKLNLEDKLINFVPKFRNSDRETVLIKHLLTQTLNYNFRLSEYKNGTPDEILDVIFTTNFKSAPGTKSFSTNATSILLGLVVQRILNEPLDKLGKKYFFEPLQMKKTLFKPLQQFKKDEIVPTEIQEWRKKLVQGEVHDETAFVLEQKMSVGSAGLFSTVPDLLNFLEMLLNNGSLNGHTYFSPELVKQIHTNQLTHIGYSMGLGWELNQPRYMGNNCSKETFGKTGFTGCVFVCDIKKEIGFVMLSNYTYPHRKENAGLINIIRKDIADIVFENL